MVAITTATTASFFISLLTAAEMLSAVISASSTPKFSISALFKACRSSTVRVLVLMITSFVPATFCVWIPASLVMDSTTGTTLLEISSRLISSLKVTLVEVPPMKSRL